jgi:hypothetical protein
MFKIPDKAIVICSLHRSKKVTTAKVYPQSDFDNVYYVVEPHDEINYRQAGYKNLITLPKDGQGICYVRSYILNNSEKRVLMLDDDINSVREYSHEKNKWLYYTKDPKAPLNAYNKTMELLGLGYVATAPVWQGNSVKAKNRRLWTFVGFDTEILRRYKIDYCTEVGLFEDFDLQLQIMTKKLPIAFFIDNTWLSSPMTTNEGGLQDFRNKDTSLKALDALCRRWGDKIKINLKDRGPEPRIMWNKCPIQCKEVYLGRREL